MDPNPNGLHTKRKQQRIGIGATSSVTLDSPYVLFHRSILPTEKFSFISSDQSKMIKVVVSKAVIKGYHIFRIRPPPLLDLQVTKEYGDKHDKYACLIWVPELELIPRNMWSVVTDAKRGERVETITGLPIRWVPQGLSSCFWELLTSPHVDSIDW